MKQRVYLSTYSIIVSALCLIVLLVCLYNCRNNWGVWAIGICLVVLVISELFYMPLSVSVDNSELNVHRALRRKRIPLKDIKSVMLCPPTMAERRICGSGGFFGYWGWFKEPSIGKYFAYYGKASDCFLVELKDGKKYLIGCSSPSEVVSYITSRL